MPAAARPSVMAGERQAGGHPAAGRASGGQHRRQDRRPARRRAAPGRKSDRQHSRQRGGQARQGGTTDREAGRQRRGQGAALAAASLLAVLPIAPRPSQLPILSIETRLVDADSILNIPANLFDDIANIPYNEVQGLNTIADSLFFSENWWVAGATNLWGIDPGDPTHVELAFSWLPFPALTQGVGGLDYEVTGLLASELPVSSSCDAASCVPIVPPEEITGVTGIDRDIGLFNALDNYQDFGLFANWFKVPFTGPDSLSTGYYFNPSADGSTDPSGPAYSGFGFDNDPSGDYFLGGTVDPETGAPAYDTATGVFDPNATEMAWAGHTFTLDLAQPFENFYQSLIAPPSTDGLFGTGIDPLSFDDFFRALQSIAAGLVVDFNPFVPGSPVCPGDCDIFGLNDTTSIVQAIGALWPGNTTINEWLDAVQGGYANVATPTQIADTIGLLQTGMFTYSPETTDQIVSSLNEINPTLAQLAVNAGILTDPGIVDWYATGAQGMSTTTPDLLLQGDNPSLVVPDLLHMIDPAIAANMNDWWPDLLTAIDPSGQTLDLLTNVWADLASIF